MFGIKLMLFQDLKCDGEVFDMGFKVRTVNEDIIEEDG